ncbi:High-affinity nicotinic acid transporter [Neolecta irregularis DAH-3]|uniref:High-affinity nicotinic acid transporter n=1 Tax=Neolecta irregularis (strain DAH-3) TaxID=1198029 RepID=A0A1U7LM91_NEOID|nr:High-affinity nicotinic acid transporter [Neolecta irregularis DAH-3]|eukprot:OLL23631.1 High-affinity nicotinic acid transporter [Neolecta irregularis DAH-3]
MMQELKRTVSYSYDKDSIAHSGHDEALQYIREQKKLAEKKLVRKLDMVIMPLTMLLYLAAYLDRSNLGNAKLQGLEKDILNNDSNKFDWIASMFYIAYVIFGLPVTLGVKYFDPSTWIAVCTIIWGTASTLHAATFNFAELSAARVCLGIAEAGFGPSMTVYYSFFYTRDEIGLRNSLFIGSAAAAGAFGGLIAYGVSKIKSHIATWRILFLIEGTPTIALGLLGIFKVWFTANFAVFLLLPGRPETTRLLNEEERALAIERMNRQSSAEAPHTIVREQIFWALKDYKVWMCALVYQGLNVALSSISTFLPTIVKSLGYSNARAQLFSVPPYSVAFVVMLLAAWNSDRVRNRGFHICPLALVSALGYAILSFEHHNDHVRYFATFLIVSGTYPGIPLTLSWVANNAATETKRTIATPMVICLGHIFSIIGTRIFPRADAPRYKKGFAICLGGALWAAILSLLLSLLLRWQNKRKDELHGKPVLHDKINTSEMGDSAPGFRFVP